MAINPVPLPTPSASTGLADSVWIKAVRDALRDYPKSYLDNWPADGKNGVLGPGALPVSSSHAPMISGSVSVSDATSSTNYAVISSGTPTTGQVLVNYDTGELTFGVVPVAAHNIQWTYQYARWTDASILSGLYAGLRVMFPKVGKTMDDTSLTIKALTWDYQLPAWLQDPRSRLINVEIADPGIATIPYREIRGGYQRSGVDTVRIPRATSYTPGTARIKITGWGPYLYLADLEPQLFELPIWYCLSTLLPKQESKRVRQDTQVPLSGEAGTQAGLLTSTGDYYYKRFQDALTQLSRLPGPGLGPRMTTTYDRNSRY